MKRILLLNILLLYGLLIPMFFGCRYYHDLDKIESTKQYFDPTKQLDTTNYYKTTPITSILEPGDSLFGTYSFIVIPGYHGHALTLRKDSTFTENMYTDLVRRRLFRNIKKGKWYIKNNELILKDRMQNKHSYIFVKYAWTIFLIPTTKNKAFKIQFDKKRMFILSLSNSAATMRWSALDKSLVQFKELCFYRVPNK